MKVKFCLSTLFIIFCATNVYAATSRDLLIQKELDCIDQNKNSTLTWQDVCSMPDPAPANNALTTAPQKQDDPPDTSSSIFNSRENTFSLAADMFYYHYYEPDKIAKYSGVWSGGEGTYIFRPQPGTILYNPIINFFSLDGEYDSGKSDWTGDVPNKLVEKDISGAMFDLRLLLGRDFIPLSYLRLTPYVGYGERYKSDYLDGHNNLNLGVIGYDTADLYYYIPIGLTTDLMVNSDYEVSLNLEYDDLVKGTQNYSYSDANPEVFQLYGPGFNSDNAHFSQDHGYGLRTSLKLLRHFSKVDVFIEPYVEYWNVHASKAVTVFQTGSYTTIATNKNSTAEVGCKFGIEF